MLDSLPEKLPEKQFEKQRQQGGAQRREKTGGAGGAPEAVAGGLPPLDPSLHPSAAQGAVVLGHWSENGRGAQQGANKPGEGKSSEAKKSEQDERTKAAKGFAGTGGTLPHLDTLQRLLGTEHDLSSVTAHMDSSALGATSELGVLGMTSGERIAFGIMPDLFLVAHEVAHVLQQRAGVQLQNGMGQEQDHYEEMADAIAARVVAGQSAEDLLPRPGGRAPSSGAVQFKKAATPTKAAAPSKEQQEAQAKAQADATALAAALGQGGGAANAPEILRIINQPAEQLRLIRTAYEKNPPPGSKGMGQDVLAKIPAENRSVAVKQLTRAGAAPLTELTPTDRKDAATHDGGANAPLGQGDEVLDDNNRVIAVFPATADGVVQAAFYELHRGEKRSLQEIMADQTGAKTDRGASAAIEQGSSNRSQTGAPSIGHVTTNVKGKDNKTAKVTSSLGAIEVYQRAGGQAPGVAWCGCFATFVYARAGITVPSLAWSLNVPNVMAGMGDEQHPGAYYQVTSAANAHRKKGDPANSIKLRTGQHSRAGADGVGNQSYKDSQVGSLTALDIRPGDVFWQQHSPTEGHVGIIVGVNKTATAITCVTIEGNASNMLRSHVRTITRANNGAVTSGFKGWGRPPQLNTGGGQTPAGGQTPGAGDQPAVGENEGPMPAWMTAAQDKPKTGHESTR